MENGMILKFGCRISNWLRRAKGSSGNAIDRSTEKEFLWFCKKVLFLQR